MTGIAVGTKTYFDNRKRKQDYKWRLKNAKPKGMTTFPRESQAHLTQGRKLENIKHYLSKVASFYLIKEEAEKIEDLEKETARIKMQRLYDSLMKYLPDRNLTTPTSLPVSLIHHHLTTRFNTRKLSSLVFPYHSEAETTKYETDQRKKRSSSSLKTNPITAQLTSIAMGQTTQPVPDTIIQVKNSINSELDNMENSIQITQNELAAMSMSGSAFSTAPAPSTSFQIRRRPSDPHSTNIKKLKIPKRSQSKSVRIVQSTTFSIEPSKVGGVTTISKMDNSLKRSNVNKKIAKKRGLSRQASMQNSVLESSYKQDKHPKDCSQPQLQ